MELGLWIPAGVLTNKSQESLRARVYVKPEGVLLPFARRWFPGKEQAPSGSLGGLLVLQVEVEQPDNVDALPALFHPMKHISTREERRRGLEYEKYWIECDPGSLQCVKKLS
jgi:uncharacterized protein (DUF3820 family)